MRDDYIAVPRRPRPPHVLFVDDGEREAEKEEEPVYELLSEMLDAEACQSVGSVWGTNTYQYHVGGFFHQQKGWGWGVMRACSSLASARCPLSRTRSPNLAPSNAFP